MIKIKYISEKDWSAWREIRLEALKSQPESFGSSYEEELLLDEHEWKKSIDDSLIFGAFLNDELVGCAGFFIFKYLKMKHKGVMFGLYVKPKARNKRVANKLIETIIVHAKTRVNQLQCSVVTTNQTALKLYQKHGFQIFGIEHQALKIKNEYFDEYLLVLDLNPVNKVNH